MNDNLNRNSSQNDLSNAQAGRDIKVDQRQQISHNTQEVVYRGDRSDDFITEFLCKQVLERLGVMKTLISGFILFIIGAVGFLTSINSILVIPGGIKVFSYLPQLSSAMAPHVLMVSLVLALAGITLLGLYEYKKNTTCPKCGQFYALKEYKNPWVKEVNVRNGTRVYTKRYYKCSKCGKEVTREFQEMIENA